MTTDWPWSALGLTETSDKEAIRAAFDARRAQLDAEAARISEFARLTEAREKALFLASEKQREQERQSSTETVEPPVKASLDAAPSVSDPPSPSPSPPPPPPPPPDPEPQEAPTAEEDDGGGRYGITSDDIVESFGLPDDPKPSEWEEGGRYKADHLGLGEVFEPLDFDDPRPAAHEYAPGERQSGDFGAFLERYSLNKPNALVMGVLFLAVAFCTVVDSGNEAETKISGPTAEQPEPETVTLAATAREDAMASRLFGNGLTYSGLAAADEALAIELGNRLAQPGEGFDAARAHLRRRILDARAGASKDQAVAIAELHLAWLQTAEAAGAAQCRSVTAAQFLEGVPVMRGDWVVFEQSVAAQLLQSGALRRSAQGFTRDDIPAWAYISASQKSGLSIADLRAALAVSSNPNRCQAEIALLQAMLERRENVTPTMLAAI